MQSLAEAADKCEEGFRGADGGHAEDLRKILYSDTPLVDHEVPKLLYSLL